MNILADTNIWCDHFREHNSTLAGLLEYDFLVMHETIVGELSVGGLPHRKQTLSDLRVLPRLPSPSFSEALHLIEEQKLWGRGVQWNDFLILASVLLAGDTLLLTRDRRLGEIAAELGVRYQPA